MHWTGVIEPPTANLSKICLSWASSRTLLRSSKPSSFVTTSFSLVFLSAFFFLGLLVPVRISTSSSSSSSASSSSSSSSPSFLGRRVTWPDFFKYFTRWFTFIEPGPVPSPARTSGSLPAKKSQ